MEEGDKRFVFWNTACGMKFTDTDWENVRSAREYVELGPALRRRPPNTCLVPGVGSVVPEWSYKVKLLETDCDTCDRYLNLKVLASAEL